MRGVELNANRRKVDATGAAAKAALAAAAAPPLPTTALRSAGTPNVDVQKGAASAAKSTGPARATPRRLDKDLGSSAAAASASHSHVRRSADKENGGVGE